MGVRRVLRGGSHSAVLLRKQRVVLAAGCGGRGREQVQKDAAALQPSD
jgi:hypothetical protein